MSNNPLCLHNSVKLWSSKTSEEIHVFFVFSLLNCVNAREKKRCQKIRKRIDHLFSHGWASSPLDGPEGINSQLENFAHNAQPMEKNTHHPMYQVSDKILMFKHVRRLR